MKTNIMELLWRNRKNNQERKNRVASHLRKSQGGKKFSNRERSNYQ
jgi:hypothetical protein